MVYRNAKDDHHISRMRAVRLFVALAVAVSSFAFSACKKEESSEETSFFTVDTRPTESVPQVGTVPEEFQKIIEEDRFRRVRAYSDRIFHFEGSESDEGQRDHTITMMDLYGNPLASYTIQLDDAYDISGFTPTSDGGFIFAAGYNANYIPGRDLAEKGYHSEIIRCDEKGQVVFDTVMEDVAIAALKYCIEMDGNFYFFGETPKDKYPDVAMQIVDGKGNPVSFKTIGGSSHDQLRHVEKDGDGFVLLVDSMSEDGDFSGSGANFHELFYQITIDKELNITGKEQLEERPPYPTYVGEKDGKPLYSNDPMFDGFDAGGVGSYIDYGDTYLLVSNHITGEYPYTPPQISSIWYYTETVYSMYDKSGTLIFRASVDSSRDYDSIEKSMLNV